jgi:type IV secretory pathway VirB6-like protein
MVKKKKQKKELTIFEKINDFMDKIVEWFKTILAHEHNDKMIADIAIKIIVGFILIGIAKVLFLIIKSIGTAIISFIFSPLDTILLFLWNLLIETSLLIVSILIIIAIIQHIKSLNSNTTNNKTNKKVKEVKEEKTKEQPIKDKIISNNEKTLSSIIHVIMIIIKVITIIAIIPFVFINIALFITLGVLISLAINGILLVGAICISIGTILIISSLSGILIYLVFKGGNK